MNLDFRILLFIFVHITNNIFMGEIAVPIILKHPTAQIVQNNSSFALLCETNIDKGVEISWLFENRPLKPSYDVEIQDNFLFLKKFGLSHTALPGTYTCVVNSPQGKLLSKPAEVSLPSLSSPLPNMNVIALNASSGNDIVIKCTLPIGKPAPIPLFFTPKGTLVRSSAKYRILTSGNLQIIDVQTGDTGEYVCAGQNPISKQIINTTSVTLTVKRVDERLPLSVILEPPSASRFIIGQNASLECSVAGNPPPSIKWEKFGGALLPSKGYTDHGILHLVHLTNEDKGTYICKVSRSNSLTDFVFTSLVDVEEPPSFEEPHFKAVKIKTGSNLDLKCNPRGKPVPTITWYFNAHVINASEPFSILENSLYVLQVSHDEEGIYQCFARNSHGIEYLTFYVTVDGPNYERGRPLIRIGPTNASVYEGDTIVLTCVTEFADAVRWLHDGVLIDPHRMHRYEITALNGLRILSARRSDTGLYTCIAIAEKEEAQASGFLEVFGEQDEKVYAIRNVSEKSKMSYNEDKEILYGDDNLIVVSLIDITETSDEDGVLLKWEVAKGSSLVDYFKVMYQTDDSNYFSLDESLSPDVRSYTVSSLLPAKKYTFQVEAVSKLRRKYPSNAVNFSKSEALQYENNFKPLSPPVIVDVWEIPSESNRFSIGLKWKVNDTNELIDGFHIYYRPASSNSNYTKIVVPNAPHYSLHSYMLKNLDAYMRYEIRVCSFNKKWTSGFSNSVSISSSGPGNLDNNIVWMQDATQLHLDYVSNTSRLGVDDFSSNVIYSATGIIVGALLIFFLALLFICTYRHYQQRRQLSAGKNSVCYCDSSSRHSSVAKYAGTNTFNRGLYINGCSGCKYDNSDPCHAISFSLCPSNESQQDSSHKVFSENFYHTLNSIGATKYCEHANITCPAVAGANIPGRVCCGHHVVPKCIFGQQLRPVIWTHSLKRSNNERFHSQGNSCQSSTEYFEDREGATSTGLLDKKSSQQSSGFGSTLDSDGCCPNCSQYSSYSPSHIYNSVRDKQLNDERRSRIDSTDPLMPLLNTNVVLS